MDLSRGLGDVYKRQLQGRPEVLEPFGKPSEASFVAAEDIPCLS
jgi:hypothetical protein